MADLRTILVIEDEKSLREDLIEILIYEGFHAIGASNGQAGIALAHAHQPDLIICDVMMPDLDGYSVLIKLRSEPETANIPFVFLTARTHRSDMRRGMELGADDFLTKPFTQPELIAAISTRLEKKAAVKEVYEQQFKELRDNVIRALPHELRTPLTGILGYARMLMEDCDTLPPTQIHQMASGIEQSAHRLHRLIENYLLYAQLDVILLDPERVAVVRQQTLPYVKSFLRDAVLKKAQEHQRIADIVYELGDEHTLEIDEDSFSKIIEEIADNAFKFSDVDTPVTIKTYLFNGQFHITLSNQGHGMTAEQIGKIGAYMQFEQHFFEQSGVGLGLVLAKKLVTVYQGDLQITSELNGITTVTVILRVANP